MGTETAISRGSRRTRQIATRLIAAALIALIISSILAGSGAAKPYSIGGGSQNGFVAACRGVGGTTKRLDTRVVQCTLPNGYVIVCNFNTHMCVDYPPLKSGSLGTIDPQWTVGGE